MIIVRMCQCSESLHCSSVIISKNTSMKKEMNLSETQRAVIYVRVSTVEQMEGGSLDSQERVCRDFANKKGYEVAKVFIEGGESAKTANRTELLILQKYIADKKNKISVVLAHKVDRLSRSTEDYA